MGLFEHFPYSNFHDLNLNWIISKVKNIEQITADVAEQSAAAVQSAADAAESAESAAGSAAEAAGSAQEAADTVEPFTSTVTEIRARMNAFVEQHSGPAAETVLFTSDTPVYTGSITPSSPLANYRNVKFVWRHRNDICEQEFKLTEAGQNFYLRDCLGAYGAGNSATWEMCQLLAVYSSNGDINITSATVIDNSQYNDGPVDGDMNTGIMQVIGVRNVADTEVVDARVGADNTTYDTLEERLNSEYRTLEYRITNSGITADVKQALMDCMNYVAWRDNDPHASEYINALRTALYPAANLSYITAVYTQTSTVYPDTPLNDLKTDLAVTAHYTDGTSENVLLYALTGILSVGVSTITVTYGGKTTTFNVNVTSETPTEYTWLYEYTDGLLSAQDYASIATTGTATETISDDALYLHTAKGNNNLSLNFTEETSTNAVLTAKVKLSGLGLINNSDTSGAGFRMQLSNGTAGVQAYFLDVDTAGNHKLAYYEGSTQRRVDLNNYDLNEYHIIEVRLENGAQKISIDGTELVNSNTLSTTYCTANKIMNQAGRTAGTDTDTYIKWLAFNEVS